MVMEIRGGGGKHDILSSSHKELHCVPNSLRRSGGGVSLFFDLNRLSFEGEEGAGSKGRRLVEKRAERVVALNEARRRHQRMLLLLLLLGGLLLLNMLVEKLLLLVVVRLLLAKARSHGLLLLLLRRMLEVVKVLDGTSRRKKVRVRSVYRRLLLLLLRRRTASAENVSQRQDGFLGHVRVSFVCGPASVDGGLSRRSDAAVPKIVELSLEAGVSSVSKVLY